MAGIDLYMSELVKQYIQATQQGVVDASIAALKAANNSWTGINTWSTNANFDGPVDFDAAVDFSAAVVATGPVTMSNDVTLSDVLSLGVVGPAIFDGSTTFNAAVDFNFAATVDAVFTYSVAPVFGTALDIRDDRMVVVDPAAPTKKARLDAGFVTAGQTRVLTSPDYNINVSGVARGLIFGLSLSNNVTDATNDIDISAGEASSEDTVPWNMILAATLTKQLDAAWAVGNNAGGRMSAAAIANTTYHVWLIQRSDTGVVDVGFDVSATAPTMPANYDRKRRIGSIIRLAGAIVGFVQDGDTFTLKSSVTDVSVSDPGTAAVTRTITAPIGIRVQTFGQTTMLTTVVSSNFSLYISDLSVTDDTVSGIQNANNLLQTLATAGSYRSLGYHCVYTNLSAQIRHRHDVTNAALTVRIATKGWIDPRGQY